MSEYGEPWECAAADDCCADLINFDGRQLGCAIGDQLHARQLARARDCVNALASMKNPAAVKAVIEAMRTTHAALWAALEHLEPDGMTCREMEAAYAGLKLAYDSCGKALAQLDKEQT